MKMAAAKHSTTNMQTTTVAGGGDDGGEGPGLVCDQIRPPSDGWRMATGRNRGVDFYKKNSREVPVVRKISRFSDRRVPQHLQPSLSLVYDRLRHADRPGGGLRVQVQLQRHARDKPGWNPFCETLCGRLLAISCVFRNSWTS